MLYNENGKIEFYTSKDVLGMLQTYGGLMRNLGALQALNTGAKRGSNLHQQCEEAVELYKKNIKSGHISKDLADKLNVF